MKAKKESKVEKTRPETQTIRFQGYKNLQEKYRRNGGLSNSSIKKLRILQSTFGWDMRALVETMIIFQMTEYQVEIFTLLI